jgi:hypothetical protein
MRRVRAPHGRRLGRAAAGGRIRPPGLVVVAALLAGCGGGGGPLEGAGGFHAPAGAVSAGEGEIPDQVERVPSYRLQGWREGAPATFRMRVRNTGDEAVTITGVEGDEDIDGQFVSQRLAGGSVRIGPGASATVEVVGRLGRCVDRDPGQVTTKFRQRLRYRRASDDGTQDVDLKAILEVVSPEDAGCPGRRPG